MKYMSVLKPLSSDKVMWEVNNLLKKKTRRKGLKKEEKEVQEKQRYKNTINETQVK